MAGILVSRGPNDPRALTLAAVILLTAAFVASYGPVRRASRVDPMIVVLLGAARLAHTVALSVSWVC